MSKALASQPNAGVEYTTFMTADGVEVTTVKPVVKTIVKPELEPAEENSLYKNILQGKPTNALSGASSRRAVKNPITKAGSVMTSEGVEVFLNNYNAIALNVPAKKLLDALTIALTLNLPNKDEIKRMSVEELTNIINQRRTVSITVDEYMELCGLKDRKEARKSLKASLETIYNIDLEWDEDRYIIPAGKKRRVKETVHYHTRIASTRGEIKRTGDIVFSFNMDLAEYLANAYIMPYPTALFKISAKYNPYSYSIGRKLAEHHNMNIGKSNANIISVESLIKRLQELPSYDEIMGEARQINKRIIEPFERDIEALVANGMLSSWEYTNASGKPLTDEQLSNMSYDTWVKLLIHFEINSYPDQSERLAKLEERKEQAKKRKENAIKRSKSKAKETTGEDEQADNKNS